MEFKETPISISMKEVVEQATFELKEDAYKSYNF
jgi:hypothetical protein